MVLLFLAFYFRLLDCAGQGKVEALLLIVENGVMLCDGMGIWEKVWAPALLEGSSTASDLIAQTY